MAHRDCKHPWVQHVHLNSTTAVQVCTDSRSLVSTAVFRGTKRFGV